MSNECADCGTALGQKPVWVTVAGNVHDPHACIATLKSERDAAQNRATTLREAIEDTISVFNAKGVLQGIDIDALTTALAATTPEPEGER